MTEPKICISFGEETETLLQELLDEIDDDMLDNLSIDRKLKESEGLAGEPITTGAIITAGTVVLSAILRLIERYLEEKRQHRDMKIVAEGFKTHPDLGAMLADIAKKNADVSISHGIAEEAWTNRINED